MSDDTIGKDNLSRELLASVLDTAMMEFEPVGERAVRLREAGVLCQVSVPGERTDYITIAASWGLSPDVPLEEKLARANRVNNSFIAVRAGIDDDGDLILDVQVLLSAPITKRYFVLTLKRFAGICKEAVQEHFNDICK